MRRCLRNLLRTIGFEVASLDQSREQQACPHCELSQNDYEQNQLQRHHLVAFNVFKVLIVVAVLMPKVMTDSPGNNWRIT